MKNCPGKYLWILCVVLLSTMHIYSYAQQNPEDFILKVNVEELKEYGLKPFIQYGNPKQSEEFFKINGGKKICFREYLLVNKTQNAEQENFFYYDSTTYAYENQGTEMKGRGVINLGLWGIEPLNNPSSVYAKPSSSSLTNMRGLFTDLMNGTPDYFTGKETNIELHLLVINLLPKDGELYKYFFRQLGTLRGMFVYILWNKQVEPELPDFLLNRKYCDFPLGNAQAANPTVVQVNLTGIPFPVNYRLICNKSTDREGVISSSSINFEVFKGAKSPIGSPVKIILEKPRGYNITRSFEEDTSKWVRNSLEILLDKPGKVQLKGSKLSPFQFIYIDASGFRNYGKLKEFFKERLPACFEQHYFLFISNRSSPCIAKRNDEYKEQLGKLINLNPEMPLAGDDLKNLEGKLDFAEILVRNDIEFQMFISDSFYSISFDFFMDKLTEKLNKSQIKTTIYTDYDERNNSKGYNIININKPK
jgi:hypothetical protein